MSIFRLILNVFRVETAVEHFSDGSSVRPSSKESLILRRVGKNEINISFDYSVFEKGYYFYFDEGLSGADKQEVKEKVTTYCEKRGLRLLNGGV